MAESGTVSATYESKQDAFKDEKAIVRYWLDEIEAADERDKDWKKSADEAVKIYNCDPKSVYAFNILHSNTETIKPAIYNTQPVPDIRNRFNDKNEMVRRASQTMERNLSYQLDEYDFDEMMRSCVLDMVLAGRGTARVCYQPYFHTDVDRGEKIVWEEATCEFIPWRNFRRGPGKTWKDVTWIAYDVLMSRDALKKLTSPLNSNASPQEKEAADKMADAVNLDGLEDGYKAKDKEGRDLSVFKKALVHEIWDKETRQVYFIAPGYSDAPLLVVPDVYGYLDFFDCPAPLQMLFNPDTKSPICPYDVYKTQAEELSTVSERIIKLVQVLKYRGIRAAEIAEFDLMDDLDDGQFLPSQGAMAILGNDKGLDAAIWITPIQEIVAVIRELLVQRDQIKQVIFELTGIADILRGSTKASETLGAQQIKAEWGSLRLVDQQKEVQRFCRDIFRLKSEVISNKFQDQTLQMLSGDEELPPEVLEIMRSDVRRRYLIDVETDSTIRGDLVRAQQNMTNFMNASAQYFQTFIPLIQSKMLPPQIGKAAASIFAAFARNFKLGKNVEDVLAELEEAAEKFPLGEADPEQKAKQQDAEQISRAAMLVELEKTQAEVAKLRAEAQNLGAPDASNQPTAKDMIDATKAQSDMDEKQGRLALDIEKGKSDIRKSSAETMKKMVDAEAQRTETEMVRRSGPPGFVQ